MIDLRKNFPIWKKVKVGKMDVVILCDDVLKSGYRIRPEVYEMINDGLIRSSLPEVVNLVKITPEDLGFKENVSFFEIIEKAKLFNLTQTPNDLAFYLSLILTKDENKAGVGLQVVSLIKRRGGKCLFISF
ncbi:MAG: hypothetical protein WCX46_03160 [Candidatus Paceibacterota bacterium]